MSRRLSTRKIPGWAALIAGAALSGCVTSQDIEGLNQQLADVQRQMLQLQMQSSSKEEVAGLEQTVSQRMDRLLKTEADMQLDLQALSQQIEQLQAQLEDTNYRLSELSQQIAATQQRMRAPSAADEEEGDRPAPQGAEAEESPGGETTPPGLGAGDPRTLYETAYNDYLRGNYELAILGFRQYLQSFPDTDLSDNAVYWIGECFYSQGQHARAIQEYDNVLNRYPRSDKTAGALLKKGFSYLEAGQREAGVAELQDVLSRFPGSNEARLAAQRLQDLGVDAPGQTG